SSPQRTEEPMAITVTARQLPRSSVLQISSAAIASIAVALVAVTVSQWRPDGPAPGAIVDRYLAARQVDDLDAATAALDSDVAVTDSSGNTTRGTDAAIALTERYNGFEPGPRQVSGNNVAWTEALPIRTPDNLQFQQQLQPELSAEVPYYSVVERVCAVV